MLVEQPIAGSDALVFPYHACKILFAQGVQGGRCAYAPERNFVRHAQLRVAAMFVVPLIGTIGPAAVCGLSVRFAQPMLAVGTVRGRGR